jgi:DnaJ-class molecular chaperone
MHVVEIVLGAVAVGGAWLVHVRLYPWRDCPRCGGTKRNRSGYAHRDCRRCGSTGRVRRFGAPGEEQ